LDIDNLVISDLLRNGIEHDCIFQGFFLFSQQLPALHNGKALMVMDFPDINFA